MAVRFPNLEKLTLRHPCEGQFDIEGIINDFKGCMNLKKLVTQCHALFGFEDFVTGQQLRHVPTVTNFILNLNDERLIQVVLNAKIEFGVLHWQDFAPIEVTNQPFPGEASPLLFWWEYRSVFQPVGDGHVDGFDDFPAKLLNYVVLARQAELYERMIKKYPQILPSTAEEASWLVSCACLSFSDELVRLSTGVIEEFC